MISKWTPSPQLERHHNRVFAFRSAEPRAAANSGPGGVGNVARVVEPVREPCDEEMGNSFPDSRCRYAAGIKHIHQEGSHGPCSRGNCCFKPTVSSGERDKVSLRTSGQKSSIWNSGRLMGTWEMEPRIWDLYNTTEVIRQPKLTKAHVFDLFDRRIGGSEYSCRGHNTWLWFTK